MAALSTEDTEMASSFSDEERNFLKFANLVICQCPKAVRVCFDSEFHPSVLKRELTRNYATIQELQRKRVITKDQMNLLFPSGRGNPSSESFDISLMTALLRHVANLPITDGPPLIKAGSMKPEYAVSIIKYYRNQVAHSESGTLSKDDFTVRFDIVIQAIDTLCPSMTPCCEKIRTADLSPSIVELLKKILKHEHEIQELRENQNAQQAEIEKLKTSKDGDNIRLNYWEEKDDLYVEPGVFTDMYETTRNKHSLLITGVSGIGKTISARHLALKLRKEHDFIPIPCDFLSDVVSRYRENTLQTFVIDDICGKYNLSMENVERLLKTEDDIAAILGKKKTNIITTCRLDIFNEEAFPKSMSIFQSVLNLSEKYSDEDKIRIANKYFDASDKGHLKRIVGNATFSPLICSMYSKSEEFRIEEFLDRPFETMCKELDRMKSFNKLKYCLLLLCVLKNGTLHERFLITDQDSQEMIACVLEVCRLGRDTSRYELIDMAEASVGTYLTKEDSIFKVIHDKIFDFLCGYFGQNMLLTIIKFADTKLLCERTVLSTFTDITPHSFVIVVPDGSEDEFYNRMKSDIIQNKKVQEWMGHLQKSEEALRSILDAYVEKIDDCKLYNVLDSINKSGLNPFTSSCLNGYEDLVRFFIKYGADVNAGNGWFTPLTAACREGHVEIVNMLITAGASVNKTGHFGETPLHVASIRGFVDIARVLVDNQANLHATNKYGQSPLYSSMMAGQNEMIRYLIGKGALLNIDKIDKRDLYTLPNDLNVPSSIEAVCSVEKTLVNEVFLFMAAAHGNVDLMEQIIKIGPIDINYVNEDGDTSLHIASSRDFLKVAEILLSNGAEVDMVNKKGETPLHLACKNGNEEIVELLIRSDASTSFRNKNNLCPYDIARLNGNKHIIATLESSNATKLSFCVDIGKSQDFFIPPFYKEILLNNFDAAKQLIEAGACVNIKTEDGDVPLAVACECGYGSIIQLLIENDADIKEVLQVAIKKMYVRAVRILISKYPRLIRERFEDESTPLIIACKKGKIDIILSLLKASNKLDINQINKEGVSALYVACESSNETIVSELIRMGADVNQAYSDGSTPLMLACRDCNIHLVDILLESDNICTNHFNNEGKTALYIACEKHSDKVVSQLIFKGADVNQTVTLACRNMNARVIRLLHQLSTININHLNNMDKLYFACVVDDVKTLCAVIKDRVDINQAFSDGSTPLFISCTNGSKNVVKFLLDRCNVDINQSNNEGKTALYISCEKQNFFEDVRFVSQLISFGADVNQAVMLACRNMNARVIRLLQSTININHFNNRDKLYFACVVDDVKTLLAVIKDRVDINQTFSDGSTPLIISFTNGSKNVVKFLLKDNYDIKDNIVAPHFVSFGEDVNQTVKLAKLFSFGEKNMITRAVRRLLHRSKKNINHLNYKEIIYFACVIDDVKTLIEVIQDNVNVNQTFPDGSTPLIVSCENGSTFCALRLLDVCDVNINLSNNEGETALHMACKTGANNQVVSRLIRNGANINQACSDGSTPLMIACRNKNVNAVKLLLEWRNANINHSNNEGKTALHMACKSNECDDIVSELIRKGANINQACSDGSTPLILACKNESDFIVDILLAYNDRCNVDINHSNNEGKTALYIACEKHLDKVATQLIFKGADVNQTLSDGSTPLIVACRNGHVGAVSQLLKSSNVKINHSNNEGETALHMACKCDSYEGEVIVSELIVKGANVNQTCSDGSTPLLVACRNERVDVVRLLLESRNIKINHSNNEGETALHMACKCDSYEGEIIVSELIVKGANVNQTCSDGSTPLMVACRNEHVGVVKLLLESRNININHSNNEGETALHMACKSNECDDIVSELIRKGANINQACSDGSTPLILACKNESDFIVDILLAYNDRCNVDINHSNNEGKTALYIACEKHLDKVATQLIFKGADVNQTLSDGSTPLIVACRNGHVGAVSQLLKSSNVKINHSNNEGETALHMACKCDSYEGEVIVSELIVKGANVNQTCSDGSTPLLVACRNERVDVVRLLLESRNIKINHSNNEGETALHMACKCDSYEGEVIVSELIVKGANVNQTCSDGSTPLMVACRNEHVGVVKLLLESRNININHSNNEGETALHMACKCDSYEGEIIVSELIVKGANINQTCSDGSTPLILACKKGSDFIVDILLAYNDRYSVDINHSNNEGKTALQIASETHNDKIVELLRKASK